MLLQGKQAQAGAAARFVDARSAAGGVSLVQQMVSLVQQMVSLVQQMVSLVQQMVCL